MSQKNYSNNVGQVLSSIRADQIQGIFNPSYYEDDQSSLPQTLLQQPVVKVALFILALPFIGVFTFIAGFLTVALFSLIMP